MQIFRAMIHYETPQKLQFNHERAVYAESIEEAYKLLQDQYPHGNVRLYPATLDDFSPGADLIDPVLGADGARLRDLYRMKK